MYIYIYTYAYIHTYVYIYISTGVVSVSFGTGLRNYRAELLHHVLEGAACFAGPDTVRALLLARCASVFLAMKGPMHRQELP